MPAVGAIRTSLEVGFDGVELPEEFIRYRGRATRSVPLEDELPFENEQFEVVMMEASAVSRKSVKEAHRVLKPAGMMIFKVPEKTRKQQGYTVPDIYAVVREGFNIVKVERPPWWLFGRKGRTLTIFAEKKAWKIHKGFVRGGTVFSPFRSES
jgi:SAM-dependent methyltransferase